MEATTTRRPRLEVYAARHCHGFGEARRLAREAAARFPGVEVRLVDLDEEGRAVWDGAQAAGVVVLPTYMIDGVVISLGNPAPDELFARLARREAGR